MKFLSLILFIACALANTEVVSFMYTGPTYDVVTPPRAIAPLVTFEGGFDFEESISTSYKIRLQNVTYGKQYVARICWPASQPADVSIEFDKNDGSLIVTGSRENIVALKRDVSTIVQFNVHLSPTIAFGILPLDIIPNIKSVFMGFGLSSAFVYLLNSCIS